MVKNTFYPYYDIFDFEFLKEDIDELSTATFISVCSDDVNGVACEIKYPAPKNSGFHLIHYPKRDGISITGRGFLAELIPVKAGESFIYYKTYPEPIKFIREYPLNARSDGSLFNVKLKVIDSRRSDIKGFSRTRKLCLFDNDNNIIVPFSRKFVDKDFNKFLDVIGVSDNIDYSFLTSDQYGCIVFDPKFINNTEYDMVPKQVCDLFSNDIDGVITEVDKSEAFFEKGGSDPQQRKKIIIIVVIVIIVIIAVIVIVIVICVIKKKKAKQNRSSTDENIEDENGNDIKNNDEKNDEI